MVASGTPTDSIDDLLPDSPLLKFIPGTERAKLEEMLRRERFDSVRGTYAKERRRPTLAGTGRPRLTVGHRTRFFAGAFSHQRCGTLAGALDWISPSSVFVCDGPHLVGLASLDRDAFTVGSGPQPRRAGMPGEARDVVGRRTVIEYVLGPTRQMRENLVHRATGAGG